MDHLDLQIRKVFRKSDVLRTKLALETHFLGFDAASFIFNVHFVDCEFHSEFFDFNCGKTAT